MSDPSIPPPRFVVSAPYPEGAITEITRHLIQTEDLRTAFRPSRSFNLAAARLARVIRPRAGDQISKRLLRGPVLEDALISEVGGHLEVRRLAASSRLGARVLRTDYDQIKQDFDRRVSRDLKEAPIFIGMPGATLLSFKKLGAEGLKVLHEVDATPRAHNDALLAHYPAVEVKNELYSPALIDRIENEIHEADVILSPSTIVTNQLRDVRSNAEVVQTPYGVDFDRFGPTLDAAFKPNSVPRIVYVGQISRRKGVPFVIRAARGLRCELELIGPIVDDTLLLNVPENVHYLGVLPHSSLTDRLARADAFVYPSIEDNFGLALIEASATGLPTITTSAVGAAELLGPDDARIVQPGNVDELRACLMDVSALAQDARLARAVRLREETSRVTSWSVYARAVVAELNRAYFSRLQQGTADEQPER